MSIKRIVEDQLGLKRVGSTLLVDGSLVAFNIPGTAYFVSRNKGSVSGNGRSWDQAFLTIGEGIAALNADYTAQRRVRSLFIEEGWYGEVPLYLTASDCWIEVVAPGHHDSTVLYGSATVGGFDIGAGGPALTVLGSNNTIIGLGAFTHDVLYPAFRNGANASDGDGQAATAPTGNRFINCSSVRDVADGCIGGLLDYGADGTLIQGCFFSTSNKDYGVKIASNGVVNPVNSRVVGCRFVGTPIGVQQAAGHNSEIISNTFFDDTSDRPDVVDTPIVITATSAMCWNNAGMTTKADLITGTGTINDVGNWGSDSST